MSRIIKFRGLSAKSEFVYGDLRNDREGTTAYWAEYSQRICWSVGQADHNCPVKNGTIGQFTGLLDKNGKEIYEGDIVVFDDGDGWVVGRGVIKWEDFFGIQFEGTMYSPIGDSRVLEIVDNIHENPELLR